MFLLRSARESDLGSLLELARFLDSPNLPADEQLLGEQLTRSEQTQREPGPPAPERVYQFVLVDGTERLVGSSALFSKHGTPEMPHLCLRVGQEERHAESADIRMQHDTLQLEANTDGPTELGALILHPALRGRPGWPGKLLSWGRFAYLALHPGAFEERIMAEMRASFDSEGRNAFWDAFGRRFTELTYAEADRRSIVDKSFIMDLFPMTPFYTSLLDPEVAAQLGQVHPDTRPALRLLEQAGLVWIGEIDPFDAGPFYGAALSEVIPVRETRRATLVCGTPPENASPWIVSRDTEEGFRAIATRAHPEGDQVQLAKDACIRLGASAGERLALTPFPVRRRTGAEDV